MIQISFYRKKINSCFNKWAVDNKSKWKSIGKVVAQFNELFDIKIQDIKAVSVDIRSAFWDIWNLDIFDS